MMLIEFNRCHEGCRISDAWITFGCFEWDELYLSFIIPFMWATRHSFNSDSLITGLYGVRICVGAKKDKHGVCWPFVKGWVDLIKGTRVEPIWLKY